MATITAANLDGFLYGRTDFEQRRLDKADQEAMGLDLVRRIMGQTGFVPPGRIFHVAGTNGKGSVCFYLEQALLARGERTGTFLSPHAVNLGERFRICGREADPEAVVRAADALLRAAGPLLEDATTFEVLFLIGIILFREAGVTATILETGLGGRLDTTNVVAPDAVLLTPIALDHTAILGGTLTAIAREKAGIIKAGVPCFTAPRSRKYVRCLPRPPMRRALPCTTAAGLPITGKAAVSPAVRTGVANVPCRCACRSATRGQSAPGTELPGHPRLRPSAGPFADRLAAEALPARMEYFPGQPELLLDGGHNPAAAEALRELLAATGRKVHALVGIQADKDGPGFIRTLSSVVTRFTFTTSGSSRSAAPETLGTDAGIAGSVVRDPGAALLVALGATPPAGILVIAGSFYVAGLLRTQLTARPGA
jgi:dihydrofolate synthase/folylpolyglutamate synthase